MSAAQSSGNLPKITIATICFNAERTIGATLKSLQKQAYPNLEFLVVDGGSTDNTLELVHAYAGLAPIIDSGKDKGPNHAYQKAIDAATGDLFGLLNADDTLEPGALFAVAEAWQNNKADVYTLPVKLVTVSGQNTQVTREYTQAEMALTLKNVSSGKVFPNARLCTLAFLRNERIRYLQPDGTASIAADTDYYLRLIRHPFKAVFLGDSPAYLYRQHEDSLTFNSNPVKLAKVIRESLFILRRYQSETPRLSIMDHLNLLKNRLRLRVYLIKIGLASRALTSGRP